MIISQHQILSFDDLKFKIYYFQYVIHKLNMTLIIIRILLEYRLVASMKSKFNKLKLYREMPCFFNRWEAGTRRKVEERQQVEWKRWNLKLLLYFLQIFQGSLIWSALLMIVKTGETSVRFPSKLLWAKVDTKQ